MKSGDYIIETLRSIVEVVVRDEAQRQYGALEKQIAVYRQTPGIGGKDGEIRTL